MGAWFDTHVEILPNGRLRAIFQRQPRLFSYRVAI
jgi:hypothetical protein